MTKAGDIIYFSSGSYSDYGIHGHARALQDFDYEDEKVLYKEENPDRMEPIPEEWKKYSWWDGKTEHKVNPRSISGFMLFLIKKELIEEIDAEEFYEDDYRY